MPAVNVDQVTAYLAPDLKRELQAIAQESSRSVSGQAALALREYVAEYKLLKFRLREN